MAEHPAIRVLVAEDSPTVRYHLAQIINGSPGLTVVGEARDGAEALEMAASLKPDVISMDIQMPRLDGLEATRRIMARCPTPIVMVSGLLDDEVELSFQAIEAGALAVVPKPPARDKPTFGERQKQLATTLTAMAKVRVIRRWIGSATADSMTAETQESAALQPQTREIELIAVGASAGGPGALNRLLAALPGDFPIPVVIVQHLPEEFIPGLTRWLAESAALPVRVAADGLILAGGAVYIAPGHAHLTVIRRGGALVAQLLRARGSHRYQPSVDVLLESVAATCGERAAGIILTGMGDDGAAGLLAMRAAGARTFAQDRVSSTVFGMPAAAIQAGAVEQILPLEQIPSVLLKLL